MPTQVLVTGAAGYLGGEVCKAIAETGRELRAVDHVYRKDLPFRLEVADLLDGARVYRLLEGCDAVVHLANHPNMHRRIRAQQLYQENVTLDMNVFQAAVDVGIKCLVFSSSIQAMSGDRDLDWHDDGADRPSCLAYLPIDGDAPACPRNAYALSKEAGELQLRYFAALDAELSATAIRYPFLLSERHLHWFRRYRRRREGEEDAAKRYWGKPDEGFAYLHVADAASLVVAILQKCPPGYHQLLPAAPEPYVDTPVAEMVEQLYPGVPLKVPADQLTALVDISAITDLLGWAPQHTGLFAADADDDARDGE